MSEPAAITRGTRSKGMTIERLHKLRSTWEDGDLDHDDEEEMLEALSFFITTTKGD